MDDAIVRRLKAMVWQYADKGPVALAILRSRIEQTGRKFGFDIVFRFREGSGVRVSQHARTHLSYRYV